MNYRNDWKFTKLTYLETYWSIYCTRKFYNFVVDRFEVNKRLPSRYTRPDGGFFAISVHFCASHLQPFLIRLSYSICSSDVEVSWGSPSPPTQNDLWKLLPGFLMPLLEQFLDWYGGTAAAAPPPFRPGNPALCGSRPLVTPYYCRLGDLLCLYVYPLFVYYVVCVCMCVFCIFFVLSGLFSFVAFFL